MQKLELRKFLEELDWSGCQEITIFGARCYIVEHPLGGVFILARSPKSLLGNPTMQRTCPTRGPGPRAGLGRACGAQEIPRRNR